MANNTQIINGIIQRLDTKIIELEARNHINVTMRIDEMIPYLKRLLALAKDDQSSRKFDLTQEVTGSCSITYKADGETISAGSNVLAYGETLVITVVAGQGSEITTLKVNNKDYVSGTPITVDKDISLTVVSTQVIFDLSVSTDEHCSVVVTKGQTPVTAGAGAIELGDELTITASAASGYDVSSLTVNGSPFTSGNTLTVEGNVSIVATSEAQLQTYSLSITTDEHCSITVTSGGNPVSAGQGVLTENENIVITATADEGFVVSTLTLNGDNWTSGDTKNVQSDIDLVATSSAAL